MPLALAGAWLLLLAGCRAVPEPGPRPNLIVFLVDDLGWRDLSEPFAPAPASTHMRTPAVERLCGEGLKFTQAYASPVCTPSRVSLMTGMSAARHGVTHWTLRRDTPTDGECPELVRPAWRVNGLQPVGDIPDSIHAPTLPQRLAAVGYRTIHVGKAHFGAIGTPGADPARLGFEINIAGHAAGAPGSYLAREEFRRGAPGSVWDVPGLERHHGTDAFLTDVLTTEALAAADAAVAAGRPFFLHLAHYAVHTPFDADERFAQRYRDLGLSEAEARYAALVEGVDHSLGRVLDWLDARGLARDTCVVFTSDNGGLSANSRGGEPHRHNAPLRSGKGSAYEGGLRVPLAVRWPGRAPPGGVSTLPVALEDLFPTLCELAGAEAACPDGRSFARTLHGGEQSGRPLYWHHPHQWGSAGPGIEPFSAVRDGDLKLIWFWRDGRAELYDLKHDLGEERDLAGTRRAEVARLRVVLRAQLAACGAILPARRDGQPLAMP